jgi:hypothetical protein
MSQATSTHTTSTHHPPMRIGGAVFGAGTATPAPAPNPAPTPIGLLQKRLWALVERRNVMDARLIKMSEGPAYDTLEAAFARNLTACLALQDEILTLPAQTLEDAAIQVTIGYYRADHMNEYMDGDEIEELSKEFRALHASVLLAIVKAADLNIDRLGWGEMRKLCAAFVPGGRGRA